MNLETLAGSVAPPRHNGELVFDAPWQSRAFGLAAALAEEGRVEWPRFQEALIAAIGLLDNDADTADPEVYWRAWLTALGDTIGPSRAAAWDERSASLAARPPGHDHRDLGDDPVDPSRHR